MHTANRVIKLPDVKLEQPDRLAGRPRELGTILIVDDDRDTRVAASEVLVEAGYRTLTARNGLEALQLLRGGERPLAMIIDMYMPIMDGESFCDTCDTEPVFAAIPRIITSVNENNGAYIRRWRATAFLEKPIRAERLLEAILSITAANKPQGARAPA